MRSDAISPCSLKLSELALGRACIDWSQSEICSRRSSVTLPGLACILSFVRWLYLYFRNSLHGLLCRVPIHADAFCDNLRGRMASAFVCIQHKLFLLVCMRLSRHSSKLALSGSPFTLRFRNADVFVCETTMSSRGPGRGVEAAESLPHYLLQPPLANSRPVGEGLNAGVGELGSKSFRHLQAMGHQEQNFGLNFLSVHSRKASEDIAEQEEPPQQIAPSTLEKSILFPFRAFL